MSLHNISQSHPPNISKSRVPSEHQPVTPTQPLTVISQNTRMFMAVTCFNIKMYQKCVIKHNFNGACRQNFCLSETSGDEIFYWLLNWIKICLLTLRHSLIHSIHFSLTLSLILTHTHTHINNYTHKQFHKQKNLPWAKRFISFKCFLELHHQYGKYLAKYLPYESTDPFGHRMGQSLYRPYWIRVINFFFWNWRV
jgi:hypothetical protein